MTKRKKRYGTLEELYRENRNLIFVILSDIEEVRHDEPLKEDLASMVWTEVVRHGEKILQMERKHAQNYIRVMVHNITVNYLDREDRRKKDAWLTMALAPDGTVPSAESEFFTEDAMVFLDEAGKKLKDEEKLLLRMHFEYRMHAREVAEVLEMSEGAVRAKQLRIIRKLHREITRLRQAAE